MKYFILHGALFLCFSINGQNPCACLPLPAAQGVVITVSTVAELDHALYRADTSDGNLTILVNAGAYQLSQNLRFISENMVNLTIRGATGDRDDVTITGLGWDIGTVTHIFNVTAPGFTVADMTIGEVFYHPIQVHNTADGCLIQNVRFVDAKEQLLKVSSGTAYNNNGKVFCCAFEFTDTLAFQYYTGGIDAHRSVDWEVKYNVFRNIRSPDGNLAEHAIHFWRESSDTEVEGNLIINCDRGIGFGLGSDVTSGHLRGIIANNFVHTSRDVGIGLESAPHAKVYHNTLITDHYFNSIEYRFATTSHVHIANNLVDKSIASRSSGTGTVESNATITDLNIFVDANQNDYHLVGSTSGVTDVGIALSEVAYDYDCSERIYSAPPDIGADEFLMTSHTDVVLEEDCIGLYPNPVESTFTIRAVGSASLDDYDVDVLDSNGQIHQSYTQVSGTIEIDISALPLGLYFVRIMRDQILSMQLILKGM